MNQRGRFSKNTLTLVSTLMVAVLLSAGCIVQAVSVSQTQMADEKKVALESEAESKGLTVEQALILAQLEDQGPTPELTNETWLNSEPLQLADLRGNVVIVEFWTYG